MADKRKAAAQKYAEVLRYLAVGGVNTVLFFLFYALLAEKAGFNYLAVNFVLWIISVICVFLANKYLVFRSFDRSKLVSEAVLFFASRLFSSGIDTLLLWFQVDRLGIHKIAAKLVCTVVVTVVNWIVSKLVIFKHEE